jgi:hypothetical protein
MAPLFSHTPAGVRKTTGKTMILLENSEFQRKYWT